MRKFTVVFLFLSFTFLLLTLPQVVFAQEATQSAIQPLGTVSPQSPQYANLLVINLIHSLGCLATGISPIGQACVEYLSTTSPQGSTSVMPVLASNLSGGLLSSIQSATLTLYNNPPTSSINYLASFGENLGLVKTAHAQILGTGDQIVNIIRTLWQVSRNIAYLAMIIIFVAIGLMVIFRQRINPQTVVTVQAALPGLIVGLILITFSYFIAALLVDIGFVGTWVVGNYFTAAGAGVNAARTILPAENVISIFSSFINVGNVDIIERSIRSVLENRLDGAAGTVFYTAIRVIAAQYGAQIGSPFASVPLVGGFVPLVTALTAEEMARLNPFGVLGWFLFIIFVFIMLYQMMRLLLKLLNNYIQILFLTFTAPFHFLIASLPGRGEVGITWVRNMLCNVLAFPGVFAAFYFAAYVLGTDFRTPFNIQRGGGLQFGNQTVPLFGGLETEFIRFLVAFGILIATPAIPDVICEVVGRVGRAGQIIGGEIATARSGGQAQFQQTTGAFGQIGQTFRGANWPRIFGRRT